MKYELVDIPYMFDSICANKFIVLKTKPTKENYKYVLQKHNQVGDGSKIPIPEVDTMYTIVGNATMWSIKKVKSE